MLKGKIIIIASLVVSIAAISVFIAAFYRQNLSGAWPIFFSPSGIIEQQAGEDNSPFTLPPGFKLSVFAKDLAGARALAFDRGGNLWVSRTSQGAISKLAIKNGKLESQTTVFSGLKNPHGLAFDPAEPDMLYIAEETKISKVDISQPAPRLQKVIDLPKGGRHFTRSLQFSPDGRLFVSIGSTCDVCREPDQRHAAIYSLNKDSSDFRQVAKGLRNTVFFVFNPSDGKIWGADMGRDLLGDDTPPDEINVIDPYAAAAQNFGWPICYGKNIHDTAFDKNTYIRNPCMEPFELPSRIDLQAHSAPLGLAFVPDQSGWPQEFRNNLLVAFQGSWNRSAPTGYKVARLILDSNGGFVRQEDFISGWLTPQGAIGRPAGLIFDTAGNLFISNDKAGTIYKASHK